MSVIAAATLGQTWGSSPSAQAEVRVTGNAKTLQVEADQASIEDVLAALKNAVGLRYRSAVKLDQPFSGHFAGSLDKVIANVLFFKDYSYIYKNSAEAPTLEIIAVGSEVAGASEAAPRAPAPSAPPLQSGAVQEQHGNPAPGPPPPLQNGLKAQGQSGYSPGESGEGF